MNGKTKGRAGGHQATRITSESTCNSTGIISRVKAAAILTMAVWNLFFIGPADLLEQYVGGALK